MRNYSAELQTYPFPVATEESASEPDNASTGAGVAEPEKPKAKPKAASKTKPKKPPSKMLPPWRVLLHNDDVNAFESVILTIIELTPLNEQAAVRITEEANRNGVSLVLVTHKERAELYVDQFHSRSLTVSIEPAE